MQNNFQKLLQLKNSLKNAVTLLFNVIIVIYILYLPRFEYYNLVRSS